MNQTHRQRVADPDLASKLEAAATVAGTDVQGLLDLAVESGIAALPPADGLTEVLTFEDLGADIQAQLPADDKERAAFFATLTPTQQDALLARLAVGESKHPAALARAFNVSLPRLRKSIHRATERRGDLVIGARLNTVVGGLVEAAEQAMESLAAQGDWKAYFEIRLKLTTKLQDLGVVDRAVQRVSVSHEHGIKDEQRDEIARLVELERKQQARREEIKQASAQVLDVIPEIK